MKFVAPCYDSYAARSAGARGWEKDAAHRVTEERGWVKSVAMGYVQRVMSVAVMKGHATMVRSVAGLVWDGIGRGKLQDIGHGSGWACDAPIRSEFLCEDFNR